MQDEQPSPQPEPAVEPDKTFSFGAFHLDSQGSLLENGNPVCLGPKPLAVLTCLLEQPGRVVSKQHLMDTVWNGTSVTDDSLAQALKWLRRALGDDPQTPTYIQTVHRRGYRFIARVSVDGDASEPQPAGGTRDGSLLSRSANGGGLGVRFFGGWGHAIAWSLVALLAAVASVAAGAAWRQTESPGGDGVLGASAPALPFAERAQTAKLFVGAFHRGNAVFRYEVGITGTPTLDLTLTHPTFALPGFLAFSPAGEMFVVNNLGGVSRFLDPEGAPVFNGSIEASNFRASHWAMFRDDELFVANSGAGNVLRFSFDAARETVSNGEITLAGSDAIHVRGVEANPASGELFATLTGGINEIRRYLIDASGNAVPNGSITGGGLSSPHDLAFSPWGELFVVNHRSGSISRFVFDAAGNASPNGLINESALDFPLGLDFSPWGELFVANSGDGMIHRWVFDALFNATPNGSFRSAGPISDLRFGPSTLRAEIDIQPGSGSNSINVGSNEKVPVAILSSPDFDATTVDPLSVKLASGKVWLKGHGTPMTSFSDVNGDGLTDIVVHVAMDSLLPANTETNVVLMGETFDGIAFTGTDTIRIVPPN